VNGAIREPAPVALGRLVADREDGEGAVVITLVDAN
jgi:hypothetical protein